MSTDLNESFNEQYMNINTKLKKRFLRKPNITEATNEFNALAIQCEHSDQPTFAGHAYIGAAKCENSAGNFLGEAEYYLLAARQFMKAEIKLTSLKCHSPARENVEAAIGCYIQVLSKYPNKSPLLTSVVMELANNLVVLNYKREAISYYEQALESIDENNALQLKCLSNLLALNVQSGRYDIALETANTICDLKLDIPQNVLADVQINRVLLAFIVEPIEARQPASLKKLLKDLLNDDDDDDDNDDQLPFSTDVKLKLQSIIISCSMNDVEALIQSSADINTLFTLQQLDLLVHLIRQMETKV